MSGLKPGWGWYVDLRSPARRRLACPHSEARSFGLVLESEAPPVADPDPGEDGGQGAEPVEPVEVGGAADSEPAEEPVAGPEVAEAEPIAEAEPALEPQVEAPKRRAASTGRGR